MANLNLIDLEQFVLARRQSGVSDATIKRELSFVSVIINKFNLQPSQTSKLLPNPVKLVALRASKERQRYLQKDEIRKLMQALNTRRRRHILWFVLIDLNSGFRKSEILGLKWQDVDFESQVILLQDTKSGNPHSLPMNQSLLRSLNSLYAETIAQGKPIEYVISKSDGSRFLDIKKGFKNACREAGIEDLVIHDLRHTFATWLVKQGVHLYEVKDLLNHSSIQVTERYAHHENQYKKTAVEKLDGTLFDDGFFSHL